MTIDERISAELRQEVPHVDEHGAWDQIQARAAKRRNRKAIALVTMPAAALVLLLVGLRLTGVSEQTDPSAQPAQSFVGIWVTLDGDGSTSTMTVQASEDGAVEIVVLDDYASVCSGAPSTMTGTGRLEGATELVIPTPVLTCDDGSEPVALSGPPLHEQLLDLTFIYQLETDALTDNLGSVWAREGAENPSPEPAAMGWWPQSNLEEVSEAQERADAGDPDYTWQLDPKLDGDAAPWGAEIFARFIEEELGWEEFTGGWDGSGYLTMGAGGGVYEGVTFIRCAPGQTNPLNPLFADAPPEIRRCAPTIDELRYETVSVDVSQPWIHGPSGIWVVDRWELLQPTSVDPNSLFGLVSPEYDQVLQVVPPSEAEVTAFLEAFLRARVAGEGAEQYLLREPEGSPFEDVSVPLLFATTNGALYERFELEKVQGPVWPTGWMEYRVRLFAEGGTVVEQYFHVVRHDGQLGLVYGHASNPVPTTENGQSLPLPYSFLDGEVTFAAAPPWSYGNPSNYPNYSFDNIRFNWGRNEHVVLAADPVPDGMGCEVGPAAADAEALARSIMADPNLETTEPMPVRIGGVDGLQMDVAVPANREFCYPMWEPEGYGVVIPEWRLRLYLIDYPGESAQVLTIAVIAPWTGLEGMVEAATPIVDSIEFHAP